MIEDNNCVCVCGFDTGHHIQATDLSPGDKFDCPKCGRKLAIGMGDDAIEQDNGEYEMFEYLYTTEA